MLDPQSRIRRPSFVCGYRYSYTARNPPTTRPSIPTPIPLRPAHRHNHGAGPPLLALTSRPAATAHRAHPPAIDPPTKSPTNQPTRPPTNQPTNYRMWQLCTYMFYISPLKSNPSSPTCFHGCCENLPSHEATKPRSLEASKHRSASAGIAKRNQLLFVFHFLFLLFLVEMWWNLIKIQFLCEWGHQRWPSTTRMNYSSFFGDDHSFSFADFCAQQHSLQYQPWGPHCE
jgi:hypothetical protein